MTATRTPLWTTEAVEAELRMAGQALKCMAWPPELRKLRGGAFRNGADSQWEREMDRIRTGEQDHTIVRLTASHDQIAALHRLENDWIWLLKSGVVETVPVGRSGLGRLQLRLPQDTNMVLINRILGASWRRILRMRKRGMDYSPKHVYRAAVQRIARLAK